MTTPTRTRRSRLWGVAEVAVLVLAVGAALLTVVSDRDRLGEAVSGMGTGRVATAGLCALVGVRVSASVWRCSLAAVGADLPPRAAVRLFAVTQLGKYLPGAAWPYLAQVREARRHGVAPERTVSGQLVFVLLHVSTGAVLAAVLLPLAGGQGLQGRGAWLLLAGAVGACCLLPPVLARLVRALPGSPSARPRELGRALVRMALTWTAYGLSVALLVGSPDLRSLLICTGAFALAWTVGFLVVIAPAGAGARELVLVAALAATVPDRGAVVALALVSRVLMTLADLLLPVLVSLRAPRLRAGLA